MIEPIDPFQPCEFHGLELAPGSTPMDDLGLVKTVNRFGEGVVIGIRQHFRQKARYPPAPVARNSEWTRVEHPCRMMHKTAAMNGTPIMKLLLKSIDHA